MDNLGTAYKIVRSFWDNERTNSFLKINTLMVNSLNLVIEANIKFGIDDFEAIYKKMSGAYWFGINANGKGMGEHFYKRAIDYKNMSAIKSFEKWNNIKPFILNGDRMSIWFKFYDAKYQYQITGFSEDYTKIYIVAYNINDRDKKGKRKLFNYTNKEWLKYRKIGSLRNNR